MFVVTTILCTDMFRSTDSTSRHQRDIWSRQRSDPSKSPDPRQTSWNQFGITWTEAIFHHVSNILSDGHPEKHGSSAMKENGCKFRPENNAQCFVTACGWALRLDSGVHWCVTACSEVCFCLGGVGGVAPSLVNPAELFKAFHSYYKK